MAAQQQQPEVEVQQVNAPAPAIALQAVAAFNQLARAPEWTSCSDLLQNHLYPLRNLSRVQTVHGLKIKAELDGEGGGVINIILPTKLAKLTDECISELNGLIDTGIGPCFVYKGMIGSAFDVALKYPWE
jgi:hypothetical protein